MGVAGRSRLVAQPGGLTSDFALHLILSHDVTPERYIMLSPVCSVSVCLSYAVIVVSSRMNIIITLYTTLQPGGSSFCMLTPLVKISLESSTAASYRDVVTMQGK